MIPSKKGEEIMKKMLSILLSAMLVFCMIPSMAFAETPDSANDLKNATVTIDELTYNGTNLSPNVTVTLDGQTFVDSSNYTITYSKNGTAVTEIKAAGTYTATITAKQETDPPAYIGSVSKDFEVKPADIKDKITVSLSQTTLTYNGSIQKPEVTVSPKDGTAITTADYDIVIPESKNAGSYKVTVKGKGNYTGTVEAAYTISANFSASFKSGYSSYVYTGNAIEPSIYALEIKSGNTVLNAYAFTPSYKNNINVGTGTMVLTAKPTSNYSGSIEVPFTITPLDLSKDRYNVSIDIPQQKYLNAFQGATVTYKGKTLSQTEYTISDISGQSNTASYRTARVTFRGNYTGTIDQSYYYNPASTELTGSNTYVIADPPFAYYNGGKVELNSVTVCCNGRQLSSYSDYTVKYRNNDKVGTATVIIAGRGAYSGAYEQTFQIYPGKMSDCTIQIVNGSSYPYTGTSIRPAVIVKCGYYTLQAKDYTVTYLNNVNTGKATIRVTGSGNFTGYKDAEFTIYGTDINTCTAALSQNTFTYTGRACTPTVTVKRNYAATLVNGRDYTVKYEDNIKAGTGRVIITGKGAYSGTMTLEFKIAGKDNTITTGSSKYTKYLSSDSFNLNAKSTGDGYGLKYTSSDTSVAAVSANGTVTIIGTGAATIKIETVGTTAYNPAGKYVTIKVKPLKPVIKVTSPAKKQIKVMITKVKGATKYQVKYGANGVYYNKYIVHNENSYAKVYTKIKNRVSGKTYEVKVRAYKTMADGTKVWGDWTTVKKIKAK